LLRTSISSSHLDSDGQPCCSEARERSIGNFTIPRPWIWTNLGTIAVDMRYGTSKKCGREASGVPVLRIPNVSRGELDLEELKYGPLTQREIEDLRVIRGDLLVIRSNGSLQIVGRAAEVNAAAEGMAFAGYLVRLRFNTELVVPRFIWLVMNTSYLREQIEGPIRSTVGLKNVNSRELSKLRVPLPPLGEQRRIVAKTGDLISLCDQMERSLISIEDYRHRLLDALLAEVLAPSERMQPV